MTPAHDHACHAALNLARNAGYAVFPCKDNKKPATPNGFLDASKDPERVEALWSASPGPLIGIATGEASGIDVLDIDSAKHEQAVAWWGEATSGHIREAIPATRIFRTRSGGLHAFFRHAPGVVNTASKLARGVDTRGCGGYAIYWFAAGLPCEDHSPPATWPAWLLDALQWKPPPRPATAHTEHADKAIDGALRLVKRAAQGERNRILHWASCRLGERVMASQIGGAEAESLLVGAAQEAGLPEIEARKTIASAFRKVAA